MNNNNNKKLLFVFCVLFTISICNGLRTPLDDYVEAYDPAYNWTLRGSGSGEGFTYYQIFMTSQNWLTTNEVDRPQWDHWLVITVPDVLKNNDTAFIWVDGGSNGGGAPGPWEPVSDFAVKLGVVAMELKQIPNQPLCFVGEPECYVEDALISYGWEQYLRGVDAGNADPLWCARLPMVKAQIRAHDTLTAFMAQQYGYEINKFVISGASKRGWTVWITAAVDERVIGLAALVIDIANMVPVMNHHYQAYGRWAVAVLDYLPLMGWLNTPSFPELMAIEDPISYFDRMDRLPKYNIYSLGDEFFLPDASKFYWDMYPEPKTLRYVPNCEHSMIGHVNDVLGSVGAFAHNILYGLPQPRISWVTNPIDQSQVVTIEAGEVSEVLLWQSDRPVRNFVLTLNWRSTVLLPRNDGTYFASVPEPADGFIGFMVEVRFKSGAGNGPYDYFKATTVTSIVPDRYDHPPCAEECSCGPPENCAAKGLSYNDVLSRQENKISSN